MNCIDLMSKRSKMLSYVAKHYKTTQNYKVIKLQWIASIWRQNDQNVEVRRKTFKTTQNYKRNQITMNCIDLTSKRSKMLSYVAKLQMWSNYNEFASIWRQNDLKCWDRSQNYKCDHITMNLHRFDVKTITTTQNYESDQIIMHCINLTSKRSKKLSYVPKLQKKSNYNELHGFDVKTIRNVELRRKTFKTTQNYESHQITMNCIDLMSKTSNQRKTTKVILFRWISIDLTSKLSKHLS